jgi:translation initiation factor 1
MSKKKSTYTGIVYSTDPNYQLPVNEDESPVTLSPAEQKLRIRLETKHRAGKTVTVVDGFIGSATDREELGKKLKNYCGTGGSAKEAEILIQGDHREKVIQWLQKNGYKNAR